MEFSLTKLFWRKLTKTEYFRLKYINKFIKVTRHHITYLTPFPVERDYITSVQNLWIFELFWRWHQNRFVVLWPFACFLCSIILYLVLCSIILYLLHINLTSFVLIYYQTNGFPVRRWVFFFSSLTLISFLLYIVINYHYVALMCNFRSLKIR